MSWPNVVAQLDKGEIVIMRPTGNSMSPKIKSGERVEITPIGERIVRRGDIVLAKVYGRYYLHGVWGVSGDRICIANASGFINGWTDRSRIYGVVTDVGE